MSLYDDETTWEDVTEFNTLTTDPDRNSTLEHTNALLRAADVCIHGIQHDIAKRSEEYDVPISDQKTYAIACMYFLREMGDHGLSFASTPKSPAQVWRD